jgi:hypothetical protein
MGHLLLAQMKSDSEKASRDFGFLIWSAIARELQILDCFDRLSRQRHDMAAFILIFFVVGKFQPNLKCG